MSGRRLFSLDLLRGLDMFLLTVVGPFVVALDATVKLPDSVLAQFRHSWVGFSLWDIIMPMFIFMCGAAVPLALEKRLENGRSGWPYWRHVLGRVFLLWFLGMVAQGRLATLDPLAISPFNNTLQSIAVGYLVAAIVLLIPSRRIQIAVPIALAVAYAVLLQVFGDYTLQGNFAQKVENVVVPLLTPDGSRALEIADPGYTWWLTSMMFAAMTLCGAEATRILRGSDREGVRFVRLLVLGAVLLVVGVLLSSWIPVIKPIYTLTFTAQAMGWCCISLTLLYGLTDILEFRRGFGLFVLFGQTALLAYMLVEVFPCVLSAFSTAVTEGVPKVFGASARPLLRWVVESVLLVVILHFWRAAKRQS